MDETVTSGNTTTGPGSTNTNTTNTSNQTNVSVNNDANIRNTINFDVNTGNNSATNNTKVGNVSSGSVDASVKLDNKANNTPVTLTGTGGFSTHNSDNTNTGPGSTNTNTYRENNSTVIDINQRANINNQVNARIDTGGNTAHNNTLAGNVTSGSVRLSVSFGNEVNTGIGGEGGGGGNNPGGNPIPGGVGGAVAPGIPIVYTGMGGETPQPTVFSGMGGYVPAGSGTALLQVVLMLLVSMAVVARKRLAKIFTRKVGAIFVSAALLLSVTSTFTLAADTDTSSPPTTTTTTVTVGPSGPLGPQGDIGPQGTLGPKDITSTDPSGPSPTSSPAPPSSSSSPTVGSSTTSSSTAGSNNQTGPSSDNKNSSSSQDTTKTTTTNDANVNNNTNANLGTGGNSVSDNTKVGAVQTGSINGAVNIINVANSQFAAGSSVGNQSINGGASDTINLTTATNRTALLSNTQTGPNSNNQNQLQNSNIVSVVSLNKASSNNATDIQAQTGNNAINGNTAVGGLQTGDINLAVNVINLLNVAMPNTQLNVDVWSILTGNPNSTIVVPGGSSTNTNTGPDSNNSNTSKSTSDTNIQVIQHATAENGLVVKADTGGNNVSNNSQTGSLSTGSVKADGTVINVANADIPTFYLVNVMGEWNGSLQGLPPNSFVINRLDNTSTGPGSNNSNTASSNSTGNYQITNDASTRNSVLVNASTGGNRVNGNTSVGDIRTGSVNVLANIMNILNGISGSNGKFRIGILNIFGKPLPKAADGTSQQAETGGPQELPQSSTVINGNPSKPVTVPINATGVGKQRVSTNVSQFKKTSSEALDATKSVTDTSGQAPVTLTTQQVKKISNSNISHPNDPFGLIAQAASGAASNANKVHPLTVGLSVGTVIWLATEYLARRRLTR